MRARWVALPLFLAACSDSYDGPRLQPRLATVGGVTEQLAAPAGGGVWIDREMGADCTFSETDAGLRCLPDLRGSGFSILYQDAACTQPFAWNFREPNDPRGECPDDGPCHMQVVTDADDVTCGSHGLVGVRALGDEITPTGWYGPGRNGACEEQFLELGPDVVALSVGPVLPVASFVGGELIRDDQPGRIDLIEVIGTDGSRAPWALYDEVLETTCTIDTLDSLGLEKYCIPSAMLGVYADDGCSEVLGSRWVGECADPVEEYVITTKYSRCVDSVEVWRAGVPVAPPSVFTFQDTIGESCDPEDVSADVEYFTTTERITRDDLVVLPLAPRGEGRMQPLFHVTVDGVAFRDVSRDYFDAELGLACTVDGALDGVRRCLPALTGVVAAFSDNTCTTPVRVGARARLACALDAPLPRFGYDANGVYEVGAELAPEAVFFAEAGGCATRADGRYQQLGMPRAWSDFVAVE